MIAVEENHDTLLRQRLESLSKADADYWSFKGKSKRNYGHGMFQYPAMMVPQLVEAILQQICSVHPDIERVGDPFAGSGTIMTESMMRGLAFSGTDINPLAVLLCRVKGGPFFIDALNHKAEELKLRISEDRRWSIEADFSNIDKWFKNDVQIALSRIRRAIRVEASLWARRFFWVAMAETVRITSNSRTSTFKLHIKPQDCIDASRHDPIEVFKKILSRNICYYKDQADRLSELGQLNYGRYMQRVDISLTDARSLNNEANLDVVVTSPPYGDNATTVPYGQYSYLPLQWIDLVDIDEGIDDDYLVSTHEIDTRSLGGSKRLSKDESDNLRDRSPAFKNYIDALKDMPKDRASRVTAFFRDLDSCLGAILDSLWPGGIMVWTLGNRRVGGKCVPLDLILGDLLQAYDSSLLCKLTRRIPSKRMAIKNNFSDTMSSETILVMRKAT